MTFRMTFGLKVQGSTHPYFHPLSDALSWFVAINNAVKAQQTELLNILFMAPRMVYCSRYNLRQHT